MITCYFMLFVIALCSFVMGIIGVKSDDFAKDTLQVLVIIGSAFIFIISFIGIIISATTAEAYRSEYDKLIQNIDYDKTKIIKENDEITEIYITVNGEEHQFIFKED